MLCVFLLPPTLHTCNHSVSFAIVCKMALSSWIHAKYTLAEPLSRTAIDDKKMHTKTNQPYDGDGSTKESSVKSTKSKWVTAWVQTNNVKLNTRIRNIYFKLPHKHNSSVSPIFLFLFFLSALFVHFVLAWLGLTKSTKAISNTKY